MKKHDLQELMDKLREFDVIILPCGKAKNLSIKQGLVEEVYVGAFFKKNLTLAKKINKPIYVLSSKYGVIPLGAVIEPYDLVWDRRTALEASKRGSLEPPYLTEGERVSISNDIITKFEGQRVLSFCSKFYKKHQPDFTFFHDLIAPFASHSLGMGMPFITKVLHRLITEVE